MRSHAEWVQYLRRGRRGSMTYDRPIGNSSIQRVVWREDGDIGLRLHSTYCVTLHADGTVTYNTGGWNTSTTQAFINEHGPVRVHKVAGALYLRHQIGTTPPRVQRCRRCKGVQGTGCYQCNGAGTYDYGSKPLYLPWDGSPLRFDPNNLATLTPCACGSHTCGTTAEVDAWFGWA